MIFWLENWLLSSPNVKIPTVSNCQGLVQLSFIYMLKSKYISRFCKEPNKLYLYFFIFLILNNFILDATIEHKCKRPSSPSLIESSICIIIFYLVIGLVLFLTEFNLQISKIANYIYNLNMLNVKIYTSRI